MKADELRRRLHYYSRSEEKASSLTHAAGILFSSLGLSLLLIATVRQGDPWRIVSCSVYGTSLLLFYCFSTIYHSLQRPHLKYLFRILDHASIYLVIAGTYTPFALVSLRGAWGWTLFGVVWGLAVAGIIFKVFMTHRLRVLGPVFYIAMGWLVIFAVKPLLQVLPLAGFWWLLAGGVIYTVGVLFYAIDKVPYNHAIWHVFVLAGSACHFLAVYWYVVPVDMPF
ncbi:MAG: hemolysin III family protein [Desulfuromonadales bacterium]|nr:hemolysin III family protein [Desulfuromonadales bacterium]